MNLGGPATQQDVYPFLHRLFADPDLIPIPWQATLAPIIARRRTPQIEQQYAAIGGGSPILHWTEKQGKALAQLLDVERPASAPHIPVVAFRYASPLTHNAIEELQQRGITRAIAFTQYPQYSCSTTGSSINELYRKLLEHDPQGTIKWSIIDRWSTHPGLIQAFADRIQVALKKHYSQEDAKDVILLFSAHSLPMSVVNRGDPYVHEVSATVHAVMDYLGNTHPFRLVWQSKVGPRPWMGPSTAEVLESFGKKGKKNVLLIPIAFTSDHIETLYELDLEYGVEAKEKWGVTNLHRAESLNDSPLFIRAMADLVKTHLDSGKSTSRLLELQCPLCTKEVCVKSKKHFADQAM
jgi:ferrochelatase